MTVRSSGNILRLGLFLLILTGIGGSGYSQTVINGNVKDIRGAGKYPHSAVTAIVAANIMTVSDPAGFTPGDTVLVIQMQGVQIYTNPYGEYAAKFGEPGLWEFVRISGVTGNDLTFANNLKIAYDIKGNIQVIKVPSFSNAAVSNSDLTCDPWDPVLKSGGVLALIVRNNLTLEKNIDVTGKGFRGGAADFGAGACQVTTGSNESYPDSYTNAGWKGEGIAIHDQGGSLLLPSFAKGKNPNFTGGGGGWGNHSGGGGGSNRGTGGEGGVENSAGCAFPIGQALGGKTGESATMVNRMFMGGGGGASTRSATGIAGSGGTGGGIVIIIGNTITGAGGHIYARGANGGSGSGAGSSGAGGGGGGGTIALSVLNYSGGFEAHVEGGNGGDNLSRTYGEGGGGGAGLVWVSIDNALISVKTDGGLAGNSSNQQAGDGSAGEKRTGFDPNLNGFLFNSVRSAGNNNQIDWSCSNMLPPKILGTLPIGDTYPDSVIWQRSTNVNFTSYTRVLAGIATADNSTLWDYTPVLQDTVLRSGSVFFRRIIKDSSVPTQLIDVSLAVEIVIQPSIKKYWVGPPDTICSGQTPPVVGAVSTVTGGDGTTYLYEWKSSTDNVNYISLSDNTNPSYTPTAAAVMDTWYRRKVTSGACSDSSGIVKIRVLNKITGNAITSPLSEEICNGSAFSQVTATVAPALKDGDFNYRYKWISSASSWGAAPDTYSDSVYNPVASSFPLGTTVYLRRVVFSGNHDVCKDTTSVATAVRLTRWPVIINNTITADQTIGYDSIPQLLEENPVPGMTGGSGIFVFQWQKDTLSWSAAPGAANLTSYQPPVMKVSTAFRRYVTSSACTSISNVISITVHKKITNTIALANAVNDTIATGSGPGQLNGSVPTGGSEVPGDYSYKWYRSTTGVFVPGDVISGATSQSYDPGILTATGAITTYYFRRDVSSPVVSPTSTYKSNVIKVVVLPVLATYNITGSSPKCAGSRPDWLKGSAPVTGGDGKYKYTWQDSTSGHNFTDIAGFVKCDSANFKPPALTTGAAYRRIVYSGKNYTLLSGTSNIVRVRIDATVPPVVFNPASKLSYDIDRIDTLPQISLTVGTGVWDPAAKVRDGNVAYNLELGENVFTYTVTNGTCSNAGQYTIDVVEIRIPKGFSPNNGDDINNLFEIIGVDLEAMQVTLKIINSAGSEVFYATNENWAFWDGTKNGVDAPEGTYYYLFTMVSKRKPDSKADWKGYLILKRNSYQ